MSVLTRACAGPFLVYIKSHDMLKIMVSVRGGGADKKKESHKNIPGSIYSYNLVPNIESYPKANQGVFDNFSCQ